MSELPSYTLPLVVMHDAETGRRVAISAMWLTTIEESDRGVVFRFTDGRAVIVEEDFDSAIAPYR